MQVGPLRGHAALSDRPAGVEQISAVLSLYPVGRRHHRAGGVPSGYDYGGGGLEGDGGNERYAGGRHAVHYCAGPADALPVWVRKGPARDVPLHGWRRWRGHGADGHFRRASENAGASYAPGDRRGRRPGGRSDLAVLPLERTFLQEAPEWGVQLSLKGGDGYAGNAAERSICHGPLYGIPDPFMAGGHVGGYTISGIGRRIPVWYAADVLTDHLAEQHQRR